MTTTQRIPRGELLDLMQLSIRESFESQESTIESVLTSLSNELRNCSSDGSTSTTPKTNNGSISQSLPSSLNSDNEIANILKQFLLRTMMAQGSTRRDRIRRLSLEVFALLLENCDLQQWLVDEEQPAATASSSSRCKSECKVKGDGRSLCALIQLSSGELRIELGRLVSSCGSDEQIGEDLIHVVWYCTRILISVTRKLVELASDDEDCSWKHLPICALLHIKGVLDEAFDSVFQFLYEGRVRTDARFDLIGVLCVKCIGAWLAETSLKDIPSPDEKTVNRAIQNAVLLCRTSIQSTDEIKLVGTAEPFIHILPSLVNLISEQEGQDMLVSFCVHDDFFNVLQPFFDRVAADDSKDEHESLLSSLDWAYILLIQLKKLDSRRWDNGDIERLFLSSNEKCIQALTQHISTLMITSFDEDRIIPLMNALCHAVQCWFMLQRQHSLGNPSIIIPALQVIVSSPLRSLMQIEKNIEDILSSYTKCASKNMKQCKGWNDMHQIMQKMEDEYTFHPASGRLPVYT